MAGAPNSASLACPSCESVKQCETLRDIALILGRRRLESESGEIRLTPGPRRPERAVGASNLKVEVMGCPGCPPVLPQVSLPIGRRKLLVYRGVGRQVWTNGASQAGDLVPVRTA